MNQMELEYCELHTLSSFHQNSTDFNFTKQRIPDFEAAIE